MEPGVVLVEDGDPDAQGTKVEVPQVFAVPGDLAFVRVVEATQELGERGLTRPVLPDENHRLPGAYA
jgi:hypothetical protein